MTTSAHEWPLVALGDVVSFQAGVGFPPAMQGRRAGEFPFAKVGDISRHGRDGAKRIQNADNYVTPSDVKELRARPVPAGSTLFAKIGEAIRHNHRVISARPMLIDNNAMAAIPTERVDPEYLYRFMQSVDLYRLTTSTTVPSLRKSELERITLRLPPLDEQRRIAAILDQVDAAGDIRKSMSVQVADLVRSLYSSCVKNGAPRSVAELLECGALVVHKDGNHGSLYPRATDFGPEGVPFITAKAIRDDGTLDQSRVDFLNHAKASQLKIGWITDGDVLLAHNASVGKVAKYDGSLGKALIGTSLTCFRPDTTKLDSDFLAESMAGSNFQEQLRHVMAQSTRNQVPITAQRRLTINWVDVPRQRRFASQAARIEELRSLLRSASALNDELAQALQSEVFARTGRDV